MQETIIFDPNSAGWYKDPTYNEAFLQCQENYINAAFEHSGYRYSNQIYEVYGVKWDPKKHVNQCYLAENGKLVFEYDLFYDGTVAITIFQSLSDNRTFNNSVK